MLIHLYSIQAWLLGLSLTLAYFETGGRDGWSCTLFRVALGVLLMLAYFEIGGRELLDVFYSRVAMGG